MIEKPCPTDTRGLFFGHPYVRQYDWAWECRYADADKQIAQALGVSPATVRNQLQKVYAKLGVGTKLALARVLQDAR